MVKKGKIIADLTFGHLSAEISTQRLDFWGLKTTKLFSMHNDELEWAWINVNNWEEAIFEVK